MRKATILRCWLILLILAGGTARARSEGFAAGELPREGKSLRDFLPRGWTVEREASGDLTGDGVEDVAAVLIQSEPESVEGGEGDELQRALLVLLGREKGGFAPAAVNDDLLPCRGCGGVKEGVSIAISKGVIVLQLTIGSREVTGDTRRFRYDPRTRRFILIGRDIDSLDSVLGTGRLESFNCLTGLRITETYRYDKEDRRTILSTKREKRTPKTPFLEEVTH